MEKLSSKIKSAASSFKQHNYKQALKQYQQCIDEYSKDNKNQALLFNLYSSIAAVQLILHKYPEALQSVNLVLKKDPYHSLCLMRRSQIYKKQNKLEKAMQDLNLIQLFSPDNLQISALRLEIQNLVLRQKKQPTKQDLSASDESEDEQLQLNFSNLKQIDRKSINLAPEKFNKLRKSRVTISGDTAFFYQDNNKQTQLETTHNDTFQKDQAIQKYKQTVAELQSISTSCEQKQQVAIQIKETPKRGKSILKNRNSCIYINKDANQIQQNQRTSKILEKLNNIEGKIIPSSNSSQISSSNKVVQFRKSSSSFEPQHQKIQINGKKQKGRKSCLKRSSFQMPSNLGDIIKPQNQQRRSKFEMLSKSAIDGQVIKKEKDVIKQDQQNQENGNDSCDEGSSHNIFGSNQYILSKEIRANFGLELQDNKKQPKSKKDRAGGKSILKPKSSFLVKPVQQQEKKQMKSKKSVMFKG